jgi:hypothetical protein
MGDGSDKKREYCRLWKAVVRVRDCMFLENDNKWVVVLHLLKAVHWSYYPLFAPRPRQFLWFACRDIGNSYIAFWHLRFKGSILGSQSLAFVRMPLVSITPAHQEPERQLKYLVICSKTYCIDFKAWNRFLQMSLVLSRCLEHTGHSLKKNAACEPKQLAQWTGFWQLVSSWPSGPQLEQTAERLLKLFFLCANIGHSKNWSGFGIWGSTTTFVYTALTDFGGVG